MYWQWLTEESDITTSAYAHRDATIARLWGDDSVLLAVFTYVIVTSGKGVTGRWIFESGTLRKREALQHLFRELET